jgi:hypothetical protein
MGTGNRHVAWGPGPDNENGVPLSAQPLDGAR